MADKPRDRPTVPDVMPLVRAIYARSCTGCCLHIVTDDDNTAQDHADWCVEEAREQGHEDCLEAALMLAAMTTTQRHRVYAHDDKRKPLLRVSGDEAVTP